MAPGYEHVQEVFEDLYKNGHDTKSQLCIYVGESIVVDLYCNVSPDLTTTIYSSGKSLASILLAILYDRGLFQYEDQVAKYWPEFAKNGKKATIE